MNFSKYKSMQMIVSFDIPTTTKSSKKEYTEFKKFLLNNGYIMLQYSVYSRFCINQAAVNKHKRRLEKNLPKIGQIMVICITEQQYLSMQTMSNQINSYDKILNMKEVIEI